MPRLHAEESRREPAPAAILRIRDSPVRRHARDVVLRADVHPVEKRLTEGVIAAGLGVETVGQQGVDRCTEDLLLECTVDDWCVFGRWRVIRGGVGKAPRRRRVERILNGGVVVDRHTNGALPAPAFISVAYRTSTLSRAVCFSMPE